MKVYAVFGPEPHLIYVGIVYGKKQTIESRWKQHCNPKKHAAHFRLEAAIREHGADAFRVVEIDSAKNRHELNEKERLYIQLFNSYRDGLNGNAGGIWFTTERSEATRKKMSDAAKRRVYTAEDCARIQAAAKLRGGAKTPEHKAKISAALKGHVVSAEQRAKVSAAQKGRVFSAEHRANLKAAQIRRYAKSKVAA